ncbi:unnamed protein product [Cyclocybe aegerita]|uniref:Transposase family Tnp2 protein n=1 Tax=Cyclocybe aegerita TaxID=1973307 RepID=A0A8S0WMZ1_CYCAE|nr:unnamed protein product [Cyclocybe aegerita]
MARIRKKPIKKYCRCTPTCNTYLSQSQRRRHDKKLTPEQLVYQKDSIENLCDVTLPNKARQHAPRNFSKIPIRKQISAKYDATGPDTGEFTHPEVSNDGEEYTEDTGLFVHNDDHEEERISDVGLLNEQESYWDKEENEGIQEAADYASPGGQDPDEQENYWDEEEIRETVDYDSFEEPEPSSPGGQDPDEQESYWDKEEIRETVDYTSPGGRGGDLDEDETMLYETQEMEEQDGFQDWRPPSAGGSFEGYTTSNHEAEETNGGYRSRSLSVENETTFDAYHRIEERNHSRRPSVEDETLSDDQMQGEPPMVELDERHNFDEDEETFDPNMVYFDEELDEQLEDLEYDSAPAQKKRYDLLEDMLTAKQYASFWQTYELTEQDINDLHAFKLRMMSNMPRLAFEQLRFAFAHRMELSSLYVIIHRMAILLYLEPIWIDCCVNSCIAYTKELKDEDQCPECSEKRRTNKGKSRQLFCYLPIIPCLQQMFANPERVKELSYRHTYEASATLVSDVFNSQHYRDLCNKNVTVDNETLDHKYFSDKNDIAFAVSLDSYLLYKRNRGGPSATPLIIQLYNLLPHLRVHIERILCCGVIPGPKGPKRLETFLSLFEDECIELAYGVKTFDCTKLNYFSLHAYLLFLLADIIALEKFLGVKGHNGKCPCWSCKIKAVNNPQSSNKTYYVPLKNPASHQHWDPLNLPLRSHQDWAETNQRLQAARTKKEREEIAQGTGIKCMPALTRVGSLDYAQGMPWDYMHLLLENG